MRKETLEELWIAINNYVRACGGSPPNSHVLGSTDEELAAWLVDERLWVALDESWSRGAHSGQGEP